MSDAHAGSDMKAAFLGLVLGAVVLFGLVYGVVRLTNATYAREQPPPAAKG